MYQTNFLARTETKINPKINVNRRLVFTESLPINLKKLFKSKKKDDFKKAH